MDPKLQFPVSFDFEFNGAVTIAQTAEALFAAGAKRALA